MYSMNSFDSPPTIPLASLDSFLNLQEIPHHHDNILRMQTLNTTSLDHHFTSGLKLNKHNTSIQHDDDPLEYDTPRNSPIKSSFSNHNSTAFSHEMKNSVHMFQKLKSIRFDFGNFQHVTMLIYVLKKKPMTRTTEELEFLQEVFSYIPFFQLFQREFDQNTYETLLRKLRYEYGKKDRKIFNYGDMGRKFYIILSGAVQVLVPKNTSSEEPFEETAKKAAFVMVNELKTGDSFGEISLLNSVPRTATCVCQTDTHFVVLTSETYMMIVAQFHKLRFWELLEILKKSPYFKNWPTELKNVMALHFKLRTIQRTTVLYKENEEVNSIYLIKSGEVEISKSVIKHQKNLTPLPKIEILDNISLLNNDKSDPYTKEPKDNFAKNKIAEHQTLCLLGDLELFGEDELLTFSKRSTRAEVRSTNAMIYEISAKKVIENVPKELIFGMQNLNKNRWKWRNQIIRTSKRVTSEFESKKRQSLYKTKSKFNGPEDLEDHIKMKNKEVISKLPLTFSFNHQNKQFFHGVEKYYPANIVEENKSDLEKAIFPNTTLIPFKKKLHALALGLRNFRISNELKGRLEDIVRENSIRDQEDKRVPDDYHIDDMFCDYEEIEEKDMLAGFLSSKAPQWEPRKIIVKRENPLLALSQNLNLKLQILTDKSVKTHKEKDPFVSTPDLGARKSQANLSSRTFVPNKRLVETLMRESGSKPFQEVEKTYKNRDKKMVSLINISKVLEMEKEERKVFGTRTTGMRQKRSNVKDLKGIEYAIAKTYNRKLVFVTETLDNA